MKENPSISVTILLAYLILAIGGKEVKCIRREENTSGVPLNQKVNKTILVDGRDVYDCIDVNLQPAFSHPLLKDHKIQMEPSSFPQSISTKSPSMDVIPQAQLPLIECPKGMIPILRNNRRVQTPIETIDKVTTNEEHEVAGVEYYDELYGTRAKINIYNPMVKNNSKDLSAGSKIIKAGVADGIGAGSWVYPSYSGDNSARFHVAWVDGLKTCPDHDCGVFVQVSSSVGLGGRLKPVSVYKGPQYMIDVAIFKDPVTKHWWVAYGPQNIHIGYWPRQIFHFMKDQCNYALWGGYVQGPTASSDSPQMGSGHFASEGLGKAAFVRNIEILNKKNKYVIPDENKFGYVTTNLSKYTAKGSVDGYSHFGVHTYYGGPGGFV
ncbi:uncharacterized protein LOC119358830 [Triticum dicoccoides]|uniref:uncharacterized protein LOC119358830 n=1 Tax=Triticum dicoccoides TaxID=85692 RepID=UPI0018907947|nr:uncharacterized protein LOC119358830 [Triticum dicoccoides]